MNLNGEKHAIAPREDHAYEVVFQHNPLPMWVVDWKTLRFLAVNQAAIRRYGYSGQQFLRMTAKDIHPATELPRFLRYLKAGPPGDRTSTWKHQKSDGTLITVEVFAHTVRWQRKDARLVLANDITDRICAEEALRNQEMRFRFATKATNDVIWDWDLINNTIRWNEGLENFGYPADAKPTLEWWKRRLHPKDRDKVWNSVQRAISGGAQFWSGEYRFRRADGSYAHVFDRGYVLRDARAKPLRMIGATMDLTLRKQAEEALRTSERHHRELIEEAPYGIVRATPDGHLRLVNQALVRMLGYQSKADLLKRNLATDIYRNAQECERLLAESGRGTRIEDLEASWRRKDGTPLTVCIRGRRVDDAAGKFDYFECFIENVTEEEALEEKRREIQKIEAIGHLAAGLAHDFNNLFTAILGGLEVLSQSQSTSQHRYYSKQIRDAAQQAVALTGQLLAFSRQQMLEPTEFDFRNVIRQAESSLRLVVGGNVKLKVITGRKPIWVRADRKQMEGVILRLAENARDAMPRGGQLTIEAQGAQLEVSAGHHLDVSPGRYAVISVRDTGTGMDRRTRARIFEPFFTTKNLGQGKGLGLATVYGIIKQSGGYITVDSEVGGGATFEVFLPVLDPAAAETSKINVATTPSAKKTVLVVEDHKQVRDIVCHHLKSEKYRVLRASNGKSAIELFGNHAGPIDLLITDVLMPGMNGKELAQHLARTNPALKVLFISGYVDQGSVRLETRKSGRAFIQKPFTGTAFRSKVRALLHDKASRIPSSRRQPRIVQSWPSHRAVRNRMIAS